MPQLALWSSSGERIGEIEASPEVFGAALNRDLLHQAVMVVDARRQRKAGRAKRRGEVAVTGAKMYRQKGLGRARHGDQSPPHFKGGGVAHPPRGDRRVLEMPRRARKAALHSALSAQAKRGRVLVVEELALPEPRTKDMLALLAALGVDGRVLILASADEARSDSNYLSCRNLPSVVLREAPHINPREVLWADYLILTQAGLQVLTGGGAADA
ncbi:MAG: 50S ribosomal protein L4 [Armatimonadetes bacterium]|nr:50S ribosomal protein L4 [Armatimonadota bacterium]